MFNIPSTPILISYVIYLFTCLPFHEFSHAFVANYFGDDTPRINGRLTLNPLVHIDLIGALVFLVAHFGWARPVPINPYALQRHSRSAVMWVSLAGPFSNFLLAVLGAIPFRLGLVPMTFSDSNIFPTFYNFLYGFVVINLVLTFFNLIPLAPLDGEKIADYLFPPSWVL
jgi:Zn-dependent protease